MCVCVCVFMNACKLMSIRLYMCAQTFRCGHVHCIRNICTCMCKSKWSTSPCIHMYVGQNPAKRDIRHTYIYPLYPRKLIGQNSLSMTYPCTHEQQVIPVVMLLVTCVSYPSHPKPLSQTLPVPLAAHELLLFLRPGSAQKHLISGLSYIVQVKTLR